MILPVFRRKFHQNHYSLSLKYLLRVWSRSNSVRCNNMESGEEAGLPLCEVVRKLNSFASKTLAESWDNVGLLVEPVTKKNVKKILLTNDLTEDVMAEALQVNTDLIISYHPPIFSPLKSITQRTCKERIIGTCLENRIAIYSPHTSFDAVSGGVNDWLASAFETSSVKPLIQSYGPNSRSKPFLVEVISPTINPSVLLKIQNEAENIYGEQLCGKIVSGEKEAKLSLPCSKTSLPEIAEIFHKYAPSGEGVTFTVSKYEDVPLPGIGMGRLCCLKEPLNVLSVVELVKKHLGLQHLRLALAQYGNLDSSVSSIALCAGSGASVLRGVKADLYLTGEMSHHEVLDAVHKRTHVILCDHSNTERGFLCQFSKTLEGNILGNKVEVVMSKIDRDPLQIL